MEYQELFNKLAKEEIKFAKAIEILRALWFTAFDENISSEQAREDIKNILKFNVKDPIR